MKQVISFFAFAVTARADCDPEIPHLSPINIQTPNFEDHLNLANNVMFELLDYQEIRNGTINIDNDRTRVMIVDPNDSYSNLNFTNSTREWQVYHLRGMEWKVPSEHTIDNQQYAAELQVFHGLDASDNLVALSYLFEELPRCNIGSQNYEECVVVHEAAKTCFVDSFKFQQFSEVDIHSNTAHDCAQISQPTDEQPHEQNDQPEPQAENVETLEELEEEELDQNQDEESEQQPEPEPETSVQPIPNIPLQDLNLPTTQGTPEDNQGTSEDNSEETQNQEDQINGRRLNEAEPISSCLEIPNPLDIPLREFINYVSQDEIAMYKGSLTESGCPSTVTWLVNLTPHVITSQQLDEIKSLLDEDLFEPKQCRTSSGSRECMVGNGRNIWSPNEDQEVTFFNNRQNLHDAVHSSAVGLSSALSLIACAIIF